MRKLILIALLAVLPFFFDSSYIHHLLVMWMIYAILAISLNIMIGFVGELTFGHAAFFGLGAYASALLSVDLALPFWLTLPAAAVIAGIVGTVLGYVALRTAGPQFAILTLGLGAIMLSITTNWIELTRGPMGITRIPSPELGDLVDFSNAEAYYYIALVALLASLYFSAALLASRLGKGIVAVRENAALAASLGVNVFATKLCAFVISTMVAGVAGSLYAHYLRVITPDVMGMQYLVAALVMVVIGGKGTLVGPVVGALAYIGLLEALREAGSLRMVVFAAIMIICVIFFRNGIAGFNWSKLAGALPWGSPSGRAAAKDDA